MPYRSYHDVTQEINDSGGAIASTARNWSSFRGADVTRRLWICSQNVAEGLREEKNVVKPYHGASSNHLLEERYDKTPDIRTLTAIYVCPHKVKRHWGVDKEENVVRINQRTDDRLSWESYA